MKWLKREKKNAQAKPENLTKQECIVIVRCIWHMRLMALFVPLKAEQTVFNDDGKYLSRRFKHS